MTYIHWLRTKWFLRRSYQRAMLPLRINRNHRNARRTATTVIYLNPRSRIYGCDIRGGTIVGRKYTNSTIRDITMMTGKGKS